MSSSILAFDYGEKRVGVAIADTEVKFSSPLVTLENNEELVKKIADLVSENNGIGLVVGLPRGLDGSETSQTEACRKFAARLKSTLKIPVYLIDEAATSVQAEAELKASKKSYQPGDIDKLAAAIFLEDYLTNNAEQV